MLNFDEKASRSDLYARVKLAPLNEIQRAVALNALRDAEVITDGIMWVVTAIRRLFTRTSTNDKGASRLLHNH
jgi:hypothetical protein